MPRAPTFEIHFDDDHSHVSAERTTNAYGREVVLLTAEWLADVDSQGVDLEMSGDEARKLARALLELAGDLP